MLKKMMWVTAGLFFVISAATNLFIFVPLLLEQEVRFVEPSAFINRLELGIALFIFAIALVVFGYFLKRLIQRG